MRQDYGDASNSAGGWGRYSPGRVGVGWEAVAIVLLMVELSLQYKITKS